MQPPASQRQDPAVDDQLLYTLAAKQREMSELESRMAVLRKEVAELESQVCESRGYRPEGNGGAGLPRDPVKLAEIATTTTNRLWRGLVDKFNEFNVAEDEFDDKQKKDRRYKEYYIKEAYDFDEDEIEEESRKEMSFARGKPRREAPESSTHRM
ncbi:Acf4p KNAG_0D01510 [Huiozyma naganishii CBS 8797]|uniref:Uncharacterized protein n=1 Tax=Huiozyma naganishii (strain ATCC MYA-139 / BCRC 22969 / CBS 8797 / KCTC 17520 / NBRC 10181 / NCYC 3082 / Yp74L-3) TaxID=1071383 RepID=J7RK68_HUIN7|nr:hypothetical protein KNAG_0D01510 [Kazachstania naganishii CBS 8797]CCK69903.1 hypothetical protein KNAG_0D01510 [Kazachstania naganishii CBS 8797]